MLETDPVGKGVCKQIAQFVRLDAGRRRSLAAQAATPLLGGGINGGQPAAVGIARRAASAERGQCAPAGRQRVTALAQRVARFQQGGQIGGQRLRAGIGRCQQHRRHPRVRTQRQYTAPECGDRARVRQCTQALQQFARRTHRAGWWRVEEAQVAAAPRGQFQRQSGQFHLVDLRAALRLQPLRLRPQPPGHALGHATGTARALVGRRLRDGHHVQPGEAAVGVVARLARLAAVDHHAHAGQGHRRLGHVGRQHHATAAIAGGLQHARLLFDRQLAMQRQHLDVAIE